MSVLVQFILDVRFILDVSVLVRYIYSMFVFYHTVYCLCMFLVLFFFKHQGGALPNFEVPVPVPVL